MSSKIESLATLLKCSVCDNVCTDDIIKMLPNCFSTICQKCLEAVNGSLFCKICGRTHELNGVQLDVNPTLQHLRLIIKQNAEEEKEEEASEATDIIKEAIKSRKATRFSVPEVEAQETNVVPPHRRFTRMNIFEDKLNVSEMMKLRSACSMSHDLKETLEQQIKETRERMEKISNFDLAKATIEADCDKVRNEVQKRADQLKQEIDASMSKLMVEIELRRAEMTLNFRERYWNSSKVTPIRHDIIANFLQISAQIEELTEKDDDSKGCELIEQLKALNLAIERNPKVTPFAVHSGISFRLCPFHLFAHDLGEMDYDKYGTVSVDVLYKIQDLNYGPQLVKVQMPPSSRIPNTRNKFMDLLTRSRIFYMYEKFDRMVKLTVLNIVYLDGIIMHQVEYNTLGQFVGYCVYGKFVAVLFKLAKAVYHVRLYDDQLRIVNSFDTNYACDTNHGVAEMHMNSTELFLIADTQYSFIHAYTLHVGQSRSFGQRKKSNEAFYVEDKHEQVIDIDDTYLYVRQNQRVEVRLIGLLKGDIIKRITFSEIGLPVLYFVDKNRVITFDNANKLRLYDHNGMLLIENKMNIHKSFHAFKMSLSGHFAFIDYETDIAYVI